MKTIPELIGEIAKLAAEQNANDYHVFVDYLGNVNGVSVRASAGGWIRSEASELIERVYITGSHDAEKLQIVLDAMKKHHAAYRESVK